MKANKAIFKFIKMALGVLAMLLLIYLIVFVCRFCFDLGYRVFNEPALVEAPGEDFMIAISDGMSPSDIGEMLQDKGLISDGRLFAVQLSLSAYKDDMEPGLYTLNNSMTAKEMMVSIAKVVDEKRKAEEEARKAAEEASQTETQTETQAQTESTPERTHDN